MWSESCLAYTRVNEWESKCAKMNQSDIEERQAILLITFQE